MFATYVNVQLCTATLCTLRNRPTVYITGCSDAQYQNYTYLFTLHISGIEPKSGIGLILGIEPRVSSIVTQLCAAVKY